MKFFLIKEVSYHVVAANSESSALGKVSPRVFYENFWHSSKMAVAIGKIDASDEREGWRKAVKYFEGLGVKFK